MLLGLQIGIFGKGMQHGNLIGQIKSGFVTCRPPTTYPAARAVRSSRLQVRIICALYSACHHILTFVRGCLYCYSSVSDLQCPVSMYMFSNPFWKPCLCLSAHFNLQQPIIWPRFKYPPSSLLPSFVSIPSGLGNLKV